MTPDGLSFQQTYQLVTERTQRLVGTQYDMLQSVIFPLLEKEGVFFHLTGSWNDAQRTWARDFFLRELGPVLTPIALDPAHPFPRVLNKSLNFVVELSGTDASAGEAELAIVQAPRALPRVVRCRNRCPATPSASCCCRPSCKASCTSCFPPSRCTAATSSG